LCEIELRGGRKGAVTLGGRLEKKKKGFLVDSGGKKSERSVSFKKEKNSRTPFLRAKKEGNSIHLLRKTGKFLYLREFSKRSTATLSGRGRGKRGSKATKNRATRSNNCQ